MGLFSTKKEIYVASTVYNLAGDEEDRSNFLKSSLYGAVISGRSDTYIGETVVGNHLRGPGIKQRQFFNYAERQDLAGLPAFSVRNSYDVDPEVVKPFIPVPTDPAGLVTEIQSAYVTDGDYTYFAEQYILENYPELEKTDYASEYDETTDTIIIQFEDSSSEVIPAGDYDSEKQYIIGYYFQQIPSSLEDLVLGTLIEDETVEANLPDVTGYIQGSQVNTGVVTHNVVTETTETRTYSDSTPTTVTVTNQDDDVDYNGTHTVYKNSVYGGGSYETITTETTINIFERRHVVDKVTTTVVVNDLGGGVTETVTTEVDGGHLEPIWDYRVDTQDTIEGKVVGGTQIFIYEMGSGNATLDALEQTTDDPNYEYFPYIPVRINNVGIGHSNYVANGLYDESRKAYYKASGGGSFDDLVDEVEDNPDIDDIDYCYVSYGVALNVEENACRKYIYEFFKGLIPYQNTSPTYMANYLAGINNYSGAMDTLQEWIDAQNDENDPLYGTQRPPVPSVAQPQTTTITLRSTDARTRSADNRITWISIEEETFSGVGKPGAKEGDVWLDKNQVISFDEFVGTSGLISTLMSRIETNEIEETYIYYQTGDNSYKRLTIYGMFHRNFVYKGKSVKTTAHEALDDSDTSGFLVPLHNPTVRAMSLIDSTQMATANTFMVFNSYQVVKKKWYETFLGMLLIVIVIVVASVLLGPAGAAASQGLLGTNIAVGAALGLSGTAAIVAGAVVNALAAIVVSMALTELSTELFGEKWGAIIGAALSFVFTFGMAGGFNNFSFSTLLTPSNMLAISGAVANGYNGYVNADIAEMQAQMEKDTEAYEDAMDDINDMIRDLGGNNDLSFDPMQLTNSAGNGQEMGSYTPESLDEFIHRTTMTGSDIVDITLNMVGNYPDLNLSLPDS